MAALINADDHVERMFSQPLRDALKNSDHLAGIVDRPQLIRILQWAAMLAEWRSIYRDSLAE